MAEAVQHDLTRESVKAVSDFEPDVEAIRKVAERQYPVLVAEQPSLFPWSRLVNDIAISASPAAPLFQSIAERAVRTADIDALVWTSRRKNIDDDSVVEAKWKSWRGNEIIRIAEDLDTIGISVSPDQLEGPMPDDDAFRSAIDAIFVSPPEEGLLSVIAGVQKEFAGVVHANRVREETERIMRTITPNVPWPKQDIFCLSTDRRKHNSYRSNGGWVPRSRGGHYLVLVEPMRSADDYIMESKSTARTVVGQNADRFVRAVHEIVGHAGFAELYGPKEVTEVFGQVKRPERIRMADALTEGYAMMAEELAIQTSYEDTLRTPRSAVEYGLAGLKRMRHSALLANRNDPEHRQYSDGFRLMRKLMRQLQIFSLPEAERLLRVRAFLPHIDLAETAKLHPEDPVYQAILQDPLHHLPQKT